MKVFKLDAKTDLDDVIDMTAFLKEHFSSYEAVYDYVEINKRLPPELTELNASTEDITLVEPRLNDENIVIRIVFPYILIENTKTSVVNLIELDYADTSLYVYKLTETKKTRKIINGIVGSFNEIKAKAAGIGLYEVYSGDLPFITFLYKLLQQFEPFKNLSQDEYDSMLEWLGYATVKRTYN